MCAIRFAHPCSDLTDGDIDRVLYRLGASNKPRDRQRHPVLFGAIHRLPHTADCRSIGIVVRLIGPVWLGIVYRA
ncbi:hypothetical protein JCM17092_33930 [Haloplanus litoreus]